MSDNSKKEKSDASKKDKPNCKNFWTSMLDGREFALVALMLVLLFVLILVAMIFPFIIYVWYGGGDIENFLKFSENSVSTITTVFGVWIGAGAAYFFGKESMNIATDSMIKINSPSPREKLMNTKVRDFNPSKVEKVWHMEDSICDLYFHLKSNKDWWFFVIVGTDGKLIDVYEEEAYWRYCVENINVCDIMHLCDPERTNQTPNIEDNKTPEIVDIKEYLNMDGNEALRKKTTGIYHRVKSDNTLAYVYELMNSENLRLCIVVDEKDRPTHYITSSDIRIWMLKE